MSNEIVERFAKRIESAFRDFYESPEKRKRQRRVDKYQGIWLRRRDEHRTPVAD